MKAASDVIESTSDNAATAAAVNDNIVEDQPKTPPASQLPIGSATLATCQESPSAEDNSTPEVRKYTDIVDASYDDEVSEILTRTANITSGYADHVPPEPEVECELPLSSDDLTLSMTTEIIMSKTFIESVHPDLEFVPIRDRQQLRQDEDEEVEVAAVDGQAAGDPRTDSTVHMTLGPEHVTDTAAAAEAGTCSAAPGPAVGETNDGAQAGVGLLAVATVTVRSTDNNSRLTGTAAATDGPEQPQPDKIVQAEGEQTIERLPTSAETAAAANISSSTPTSTPHQTDFSSTTTATSSESTATIRTTDDVSTSEPTSAAATAAVEEPTGVCSARGQLRDLTADFRRLLALLDDLDAPSSTTAAVSQGSSSEEEATEGMTTTEPSARVVYRYHLPPPTAVSELPHRRWIRRQPDVQQDTVGGEVAAATEEIVSAGREQELLDQGRHDEIKEAVLDSDKPTVNVQQRLCQSGSNDDTTDEQHHQLSPAQPCSEMEEGAVQEGHGPQEGQGHSDDPAQTTSELLDKESLDHVETLQNSGGEQNTKDL